MWEHFDVSPSDPSTITSDSIFDFWHFINSFTYAICEHFSVSVKLCFTWRKIGGVVA